MYIIDRIEENSIAVCEEYESGKIVHIDRSKLPDNAKEGSVIECVGDKYILNEESANKRKAELSKRVKRLLKK